MDDQSKTYAPAQGCPLQHFEVAIGISEGGDRATADVFVDPHRFAALVVNEIDLRQAKQRGPTIAHFESRLDRRADNRFGRNAIDPLTPRTHELDAAP